MFKCNYRYIGKILYRKNIIKWKLHSLFLKLNSDTYMYKQVLVCHTKKRITSNEIMTRYSLNKLTSENSSKIQSVYMNQ